MKIIDLLKLPEKRHIEDIDDPATTSLHAEIIQKKPFLKKIYLDFYNQFVTDMNEADSKVLVELGSGGGFIKEIVPNVITSDCIELPNIDMVFSATDMPFEDDSVDAFFMIDVLHHIDDVKPFFHEALRCLKDMGTIVMIEPANTAWSRFIYKNFHHESFDLNAGWGSEKNTPLSGGNGAIPWIVFNRDREIFESEFPDLKIIKIKNHTPLRYLLSGGMTLRQLVPACCYPVIKLLELILSPANNYIGMFQTIKLKKTS